MRRGKGFDMPKTGGGFNDHWVKQLPAGIGCKRHKYVGCGNGYKQYSGSTRRPSLTKLCPLNHSERPFFFFYISW